MDPTLRENAARQGGDATLREGASSGEATLREAATGHGALVPGGLFLGYALLKPIEVSSGEADLWFVQKGGVEYVLKLYRYGIEPKAAMLEKLRALSGEHVVRLEEHGRFGSRVYEILEKVEHGDLRQLGRPLAEPRLKEVLKELAEAVQHLHQQGVFHRDLKPGNVLVRRQKPLDLVLTDFGIASLSEGTVHVTSAHRTVIYSAPEVTSSVVSPASDWWSVGVMVLELLKGVHPLAGLNEQAVTLQLVSKGIVVPADVSSEWAELLKGLLTRDYQKRWGGEEVRRWLQGRRGQATQYELDRKEVYSHKPFSLGGKECYTARELAVALSESWDQGVKNFARGLVADWVKTELRDYGLVSRLMDLQDEQQLDPGEKLSAALVELDGSLPAVWQGNVVNREWVAREPDKFLQVLESKVRPRLEKQPGWPREVVEGLRQLAGEKLGPQELAALRRVVLTGAPELRLGNWVVTPESLLERWGEGIRLLESRVPELWGSRTGQTWLWELGETWREVKELGSKTPPSEALRWLSCDPNALEARAQELRRRYVGSREKQLNALWLRGRWSTAEKVALCAADESLLETAAQRQAQADQARAQEEARQRQQAAQRQAQADQAQAQEEARRRQQAARLAAQEPRAGQQAKGKTMTIRIPLHPTSPASNIVTNRIPLPKLPRTKQIPTDPPEQRLVREGLAHLDAQGLPFDRERAEELLKKNVWEALQEEFDQRVALLRRQQAKRVMSRTEVGMNRRWRLMQCDGEWPYWDAVALVTFPRESLLTPWQRRKPVVLACCLGLLALLAALFSVVSWLRQQPEAKGKAEAELGQQTAAQAKATVAPERPPPAMAAKTPGTRVQVGAVPVRWIPAGRFVMGSPESEEGHQRDERQHGVELSRGFFMAETECTQAQWEAVMGSNPSGFKGPELPVEDVSWAEAVEYCRRLTRQQQERGELPAGWEWRLPTEAEWEYAARAESGGPWYGHLNDIAWYGENAGRKTHEVGRKGANGWGLHDMLGNVYEWCLDWYGEYPDSVVTDPTGPTAGSYRVLRGGSWYDNAINCRSAYRINNTPDYRNNGVGVRAVLAPGNP